MGTSPNICASSGQSQPPAGSNQLFRTIRRVIVVFRHFLLCALPSPRPPKSNGSTKPATGAGRKRQKVCVDYNLCRPWKLVSQPTEAPDFGAQSDGRRWKRMKGGTTHRHLSSSAHLPTKVDGNKTNRLGDGRSGGW